MKYKNEHVQARADRLARLREKLQSEMAIGSPRDKLINDPNYELKALAIYRFGFNALPDLLLILERSAEPDGTNIQEGLGCIDDTLTQVEGYLDELIAKYPVPETSAP